MTTYYGVWTDAGEEWWRYGTAVFHTTVRRLAVAQAMVANALFRDHRWPAEKRGWEARVIGEDGLPIEEKEVNNGKEWLSREELAQIGYRLRRTRRETDGFP